MPRKKRSTAPVGQPSTTVQVMEIFFHARLDVAQVLLEVAQEIVAGRQRAEAERRGTLPSLHMDAVPVVDRGEVLDGPVPLVEPAAAPKPRRSRKRGLPPAEHVAEVPPPVDPPDEPLPFPDAAVDPDYDEVSQS